MTKEELCREREQAYMQGYEDASKKYRQVPCENAISRQAVDDALYEYSRSCDVNYGQIMEYIDKLPSVQPMRKRGRWIHRRIINGDNIIDMHYCSECGEEFSYDAETGVCITDYKICPACGSDNREDGE